MPDVQIKILKWVFYLSFFCFVIHLTTSVLSGSLAILADAGHKMADLGALGLALAAANIARLKAPEQNTFGYSRADVLAGLVNGAILLLMAGYFLIHAIDRLSHPHHVEMNGTWMLWGAGLGLLINSIAAGLLVKAKKNSLNAKSAYYHLLTDIAHACIEISVALFIVNYHFFWLDSALSLVLIAFMLINGIRICLEACRILMSIAPQNISVASIQSFLQSQEGVIAVEDIHLWSITTGKHTLTAHLKLQDMSFFSSETTTRLEAVLREHYDICHITLQLSL